VGTTFDRDDSTSPLTAAARVRAVARPDGSATCAGPQVKVNGLPG